MMCSFRDEEMLEAKCDVVITLQPTSPLLSEKTLKIGIRFVPCWYG